MTGERIAAATTAGGVELAVADLSRSLDYYTDSIGLRVIARDGSTARLGAGSQSLLVLEEHPGARPVHSYAGLFHFAILLPDRPSLGSWLIHAVEDGVRIDGASDHTVSEALYLTDPDGHGIEIYRDRPREEWEGKIAELMGNAPLDHQSLAAAAGSQEQGHYPGMPAATTLGHIHLQVSDIPATVAFYRDVLGFEVTAMWGSAAFMGAGGYHHHIGANTWNSLARPVAPPGSAALRAATIAVPDSDELRRLEERLLSAGHRFDASEDLVAVEDPSGIPLHLVVA